jgi:hypothetical protein
MEATCSSGGNPAKRFATRDFSTSTSRFLGNRQVREQIAEGMRALFDAPVAVTDESGWEELAIFQHRVDEIVQEVLDQFSSGKAVELDEDPVPDETATGDGVDELFEGLDANPELGEAGGEEDQAELPNEGDGSGADGGADVAPRQSLDTALAASDALHIAKLLRYQAAKKEGRICVISATRMLKTDAAYLSRFIAQQHMRDGPEDKQDDGLAAKFFSLEYLKEAWRLVEFAQEKHISLKRRARSLLEESIRADCSPAAATAKRSRASDLSVEGKSGEEAAFGGYWALVLGNILEVVIACDPVRPATRALIATNGFCLCWIIDLCRQCADAETFSDRRSKYAKAAMAVTSDNTKKLMTLFHTLSVRMDTVVPSRCGSVGTGAQEHTYAEIKRVCHYDESVDVMMRSTRMMLLKNCLRGFVDLEVDFGAGRTRQSGAAVFAPVDPDEPFPSLRSVFHRVTSALTHSGVTFPRQAAETLRGFGLMSDLWVLEAFLHEILAPILPDDWRRTAGGDERPQSGEGVGREHAACSPFGVNWCRFPV